MIFAKKLFLNNLRLKLVFFGKNFAIFICYCIFVPIKFTFYFNLRQTTQV